MKVWCGHFLLVGMLLAGGVQPTFAQDLLGLFFDEAGTQTSTTTTAPFQQISAYLILQNPTQADGLTAWECVVEARTQGQPPFVNWELYGQAINVATAPAFMVGMGQPLPSNADVLLATATVLVPEAGQEVAFYIHPFDPPSLCDPPVWGYPVHAPAYGHGATGALVATGWSSGCEANPAAVINDDGQGEIWGLSGLPQELNYGYVEVGEIAEMSFVLVNTGSISISGPVSMFGQGYQYRLGEGYFTDQPTTFHLEPQQDLVFTVRLDPPDTLVYTGQLELEICEQIFSVYLEGGNVEGTCMVSSMGIDFAEVPVDGQETRTVLVTNSGASQLTVNPYIDNPAFTAAPCPGQPFPVTLSPGESTAVLVTFAPEAEQYYEGTMALGPSACADVNLQGQGSGSIPPECQQNFSAWDFGEVGVELLEYAGLWLTNAGGGVLSVDLLLEQEGSAFSLNLEQGLHELGPGDELYIGINFRPDALGEFSAVLHTGTLCSDVLLTGTGRELQESYIVPESMGFPSTVAGQTTHQNLAIINNGETEMTVDLSISGDSEIALEDEGIYALNPGAHMLVGVSFSPQEPGYHSATISTGLPGAETVAVMGYGVSELPGEHNIVVLYFDPEWTSNQTVTTVPNEVVAGYLVLHDPSAADGIAGWEMCLDCYPQVHILNWSIEGAEGPDLPVWCVAVQLDEPFPPGADILLATLTIEVPQPIQNNIYLRPYHGGVLPDYAAYIDAADGVTRVPVATPNPPFLAIINPEQVNIHRPAAPVAQATGGQVQLSWDCTPGVDGYHVYRRLGPEQPHRLTTVPVPCSAGQVFYADSPGVPDGSVVFYSTAAVTGGQESTPSFEAEVVVAGGPPRTARLLPCFPNPFNPETRVPFVLDRAGYVRLAVFDLAGRQIRVLAEGVLPAGEHERLWNGRDGAGRLVPSGVYFARMVAGDYQGVWKMVLAK
jgi:hypothetical protein